MSDFSRHEKLIGEIGIQRLSGAHVIVFGIGGVGGYVAEALVRAAVGNITLVDSDDVEPTNLNRQIIALRDTLGMPKVEAMQARIERINEKCNVVTEKVFVNADNIEALITNATYAVDAVDTVSAKLAIIEACKNKGIPAICAMGAGNKLFGDFRVMNIADTKGDALARVMRRELRKRGIDNQKVVCTDAKPLCALNKGDTMPSISYMPGLCGLTIAGEVIRDIIGWKND